MADDYFSQFESNNGPGDYFSQFESGKDARAPLTRDQAERVAKGGAKQVAMERLVAKDPRLILLNEGLPEQNVGVKGQGVIPRALAATVGGGFTSGPARILQDLMLKAKLTSPEAVDALGVNRVAEENPGTVLAGNIAGSLTPGGAVAKGTGILGRLLTAGAMGAGYGASESVKEGGLERLQNEPGQIVTDATKTGALSTVLPFLAESPAIGKLLLQKALVGKMNPNTQEIVNIAKQMDVPITPAQATGSRRLGLAEKGLQNIPTSSGITQGQQEAVQAGLKNKAGQLLDEASPKISEQTFGQEVQSRIAAREGIFKDTASRLYDKFEKSVPPDTQIQLGRAGDMAEDFLKRQENIKGLSSSKFMSQLKAFMGSEDASGTIAPKAVNAQTFLDMRAATNDAINAAEKTPDLQRKLIMLKNELDKSLGDFAKLQGGKIEDSFNLANSYYGKRAQTFNDPKIQRIIQKDPGYVYDMISQPGTVKEINTLKTALGPNKFDPVKRAVMERVLATDGADAFSAQKFGTSLSKFTPENLEAVFGAKKLKEIQDFGKLANSIATMERRVGNPSGTAQQVLSASYTGGVLSLLYHDPVSGTLATLAPPALAKLYASDTGMKLLTEAIKTQAGTPKASELISRVSAILGEDSKDKQMSETQRQLILNRSINQNNPQ